MAETEIWDQSNRVTGSEEIKPLILGGGGEGETKLRNEILSFHLNNLLK